MAVSKLSILKTIELVSVLPPHAHSMFTHSLFFKNLHHTSVQLEIKLNASFVCKFL